MFVRAESFLELPYLSSFPRCRVNGQIGAFPLLKSVRTDGRALALESSEEPNSLASEKGARKRGVGGRGLERGAGRGVERERLYTIRG